jgi:hypothetical protein
MLIHEASHIENVGIHCFCDIPSLNQPEWGGEGGRCCLIADRLIRDGSRIWGKRERVPGAFIKTKIFSNLRNFTVNFKDFQIRA